MTYRRDCRLIKRHHSMQLSIFNRQVTWMVSQRVSLVVNQWKGIFLGEMKLTNKRQIWKFQNFLKKYKNNKGGKFQNVDTKRKKWRRLVRLENSNFKIQKFCELQKDAG